MAVLVPVIVVDFRDGRPILNQSDLRRVFSIRVRGKREFSGRAGQLATINRALLIHEAARITVSSSMSFTKSLSTYARAHPVRVTAILSAIGYAVVIGSFADIVPVPKLEYGTVLLFGDLIAVINTFALLSLLAGWWFIQSGNVEKHRAAMVSAFGLILLFLVLYVWKQAGGFTKEFAVSQGQFLAEYATLVTGAYLGMLAVHILLSVVAVPLVIYAIVLGLTHSPTELADSRHPQVGRIAVLVWSISLGLGILTYLLLNHVYGWDGIRLAG